MSELYCSFCGKSQNDVNVLVMASRSNSSIGICDKCVELARDIIGLNRLSPEKYEDNTQETYLDDIGRESGDEKGDIKK